MSSLDEIRNARLKKLELLERAGMNPYPSVSRRELSLREARERFSALVSKKEKKWIAGRVMSIRGQGKIIFVTIADGTDHFQTLFKFDNLEKKFDLFRDAIDIGDFVEASGIFFTTERGEKTLEAKDWGILVKSLRPLPEKWHRP